MPRKSTSPRRKTSPKKRGRPRKSTSPRRKTSPKKRGRPRKTSPRRKTSPKKRGRPRKTSPRRTTSRTMKYDGKRKNESLMDAANEYREKLDNPVLSHAAGLVYDDYYNTDTDGFIKDRGGLNPSIDKSRRYTEKDAKQTVLKSMINKIYNDEIYINPDKATRRSAIQEANQISRRLKGMRHDSL